ncbi:hypothetical protein [Brucella tritici]|uniref:hypothetical protein n=1 Tax=Brucella/Ochrobactrum group TaxID=2826938 RepID=UPI001F10D98D|nr:hypothetical protein [Brucella tritici]MCH4539795.1 hypothetical protein [Ochrobactrum sp. A-1]
MTSSAAIKNRYLSVIKPTLVLGFAVALASCSSLTNSLPKCDGNARRPLNRAMWQWEKSSALPKSKAESITRFVDERKPSRAFDHFDIEASFGDCED